MREACGSSRWEQPFFDAMQAFPGGLGQGWVCANNVTDHVPRGNVKRTFRHRTHRE
jgi:hypothetical protein